MNVGISTASFYPEYLTEETVPLIGNMGIKTVEVFLESYSEYDEEFCKEMKDVLDKYDIKVNSIHAIGTQFEPQLFSATERQRKDALKMLLKVLKAANILGAKVYVFHGPAVRKETKPNIDFEKIAKNADYIAETAGEYGIKFAWENVYWCWFSYPKFALSLKEVTNSKNIYFTLDIKQAMKSKQDPFEYLKAMGEYIANVHLCDYDNDGNLFLPGRGNFDFRRLYKELERINYRGPVIMEVYRNNYKEYSEMMEGIIFLKEIFDR
ncbi:sugar phosphate isomerase/epimerase [Thermoanaerobacterium sp. RBIITD]|uniref:sugar phosphate isomerase/epimerase family protein n=1 Tax=Thermoanaerobacterium sp. RBIITD TaxID=1550240 RepID=UPI000BB971FF|nr:sugar phosphate isomerase/epimerase [Thermoanaerobacterium sp. RBIITD]SNX54853.1 Sugar phosphate isomerase/epimerase [Thermoanaerobacterium sp. RBIITD]